MFGPYRDAGAMAGWSECSLLVAAALFVLSLVKAVYQFLGDPLRDIPGPILAKFTRIWLLKQYAGGLFHKTNLELHKKYGE